MTPYYPTHTPRRRIEIAFWWALTLTALMVDLSIFISASRWGLLIIPGALATIICGAAWARATRRPAA